VREISQWCECGTTRTSDALGGWGCDERILFDSFSVRILDSSVESGIPSSACRPEGPNTRPPVAQSASRAPSRAKPSEAGHSERLSTRVAVDIHAIVTVNCRIGHDHRPAAITFGNSRTFQATGYDFRSSRVRLRTRSDCLAASRVRAMMSTYQHRNGSWRSERGRHLARRKHVEGDNRVLPERDFCPASATHDSFAP